MKKLSLAALAVCLFLSVPAFAKKARTKVKTSQKLERVPVTVSFAAEEGWEEAEKARADFIRKSRERRKAQEKLESSKRSKTVAVKAPREISKDDISELNNSKKEVGLQWRSAGDELEKETSIDGELPDFGAKEFEISNEEKAEIAALLRKPSSSPEMIKPITAVSPKSLCFHLAD